MTKNTEPGTRHGQPEWTAVARKQRLKLPEHFSSASSTDTSPRFEVNVF